MNKIFITGSSGFVGKYFINYFSSKFEFLKYSQSDEIIIQQDIVLHFAGKAHDHKNITNPHEY